MNISPYLGRIAARLGRNFTAVAAVREGGDALVWRDSAGTPVTVTASTLVTTLDSFDAALRQAELETGKKFSSLSAPASIIEANLSVRKEIETAAALYRRNPWGNPRAKQILKSLKEEPQG